MILLYRVFSILLYPTLFVFIYFRKILKKEDPIRFKEKIFISHYNAHEKIENSKLIWFHAASIGEFKSIIPIINELEKADKNLKFLITTTTVSSGKLAETELKKFNNAEHRYLPFDITFLMDNFLRLWKPDKIFLVDSEIWPNLILKAKQFKIPIAIINARLTARSFKRWMFFPSVAKSIFEVFDLFLCSNLETENYLRKLNLKNIYNVGNIKLVDDIDKKNVKNINDNILIKKRFWLAASTHKQEDSFCLKTHIKLKEKFEDLITIIAPRHIERSKDIESLSKKYHLEAQILNKNDPILYNKEIIIINYFGALQNYFKYAKSVFIGKSMIKKLKHNGGQNPIEAAKQQCKIYHGPYVYNFEEIYKILKNQKISKEVMNIEELSNNLAEDLGGPSKQVSQISNPIKSLGQKTLLDTMKFVEKFLYNDVN